jgi:hypothetical protein
MIELLNVSNWIRCYYPGKDQDRIKDSLYHYPYVDRWAMTFSTPLERANNAETQGILPSNDYIASGNKTEIVMIKGAVQPY